MKPQEETCVTVRANRFWKIGEPLDGQSLTSEIPLKIREKLGSPPANHKYIQINEDILLININTNIVSDMILDFGGIRVKKAQPQSGPKPNK